MGKLFCVLGLHCVIAIALAAQSPVPNFAGTWTLDKSKSQDLAPSYKSFERVSWVISQNREEISIEQKYMGFAVKDLRPSAPGRGGGGSPIGLRIYKLNGEEIIKHIDGSKFARKAIVSSDGQTLELIEMVTLRGAEGTTTTNDKLSLSADGKTLTVLRQRDGPGPKNSTLVFTR
jgi:hypothetical protein